MKTRELNINSAARFLSLMAALGLTSTALAKTVILPAGSVNALAAAVANAGLGGTVIVKTGLHTESGEVLVGFRAHILGEPGAILQSGTSPGATFPITVLGGIHLKGAAGATVSGIWFRPPSGSTASCAVVVEDSPHAEVVDNRVTESQYGVIVQGSDFAVVRDNNISVTVRWSLPASDPAFLIDAEGIMVIKGQKVHITGNQVANAIIGIFGGDVSGQVMGNSLSGNYIGAQLCHIPVGFYKISGSDAASPQPGNLWVIANNVAHNNAWGIQLTDSSHDNRVVNNDATGNGDPAVWGVLGYDIELTGDTTRFAPYPPVAGATFNNLAVAGEYKNVVLKDCGNNDAIAGQFNLVDTSKDPCY